MHKTSNNSIQQRETSNAKTEIAAKERLAKHIEITNARVSMQIHHVMMFL